MKKTVALALVWFGALPCLARADFLINNGGFEVGFASWTRADQAGGDGTFALQSGTTSPVNLDPVPAPSGGIRAAMSDGQGPGSHVLYQDFVVPTFPITAATLSFDLFLGNRSTLGFATPNPATLDFSIAGFNQQARVDILRGGTDPFSVAAADVLLNVFQTQPGDPAIQGYRPIVANLTALLAPRGGQTLRLRFASVDNIAPLQFGVDNVSLNVVPEPATWALAGIGFTIGAAGAAALRGRRLGRRSRS